MFNYVLFHIIIRMLGAHEPDCQAKGRTAIRHNHAMRLVLVLFATLLVAACYPELDWREIRSEEGRFSILMPARPIKDSRALSGKRSGAMLQQWSARARETAFAAGYADLLQADESAVGELRDALLRNISGKVLEERSVAIEGVSGREILAQGRIGDTAVMLRLRLIVVGNRLYQLAVLGPIPDFQASELEPFFLSFKIMPDGH